MSIGSRKVFRRILLTSLGLCLLSIILVFPCRLAPIDPQGPLQPHEVDGLTQKLIENCQYRLRNLEMDEVVCLHIQYKRPLTGLIPLIHVGRNEIMAEPIGAIADLPAEMQEQLDVLWSVDKSNLHILYYLLKKAAEDGHLP